MRRRRTALWLAAALALGSPVPAQAQDVTPPADTEEDPEDPEATLVRLRQRVRDAEGAARAAAAVNLATFFGEQRRWLAAADAWGVARRIEESAEHCLGEARARLAFAEEVLSAGGIGAGIRAAFEDARLGLSRARKNGADTAEVAIGLARCAEAQGNPDAALRELERALARWPEDPVPRRRLAFACLNAGRHERAAELLQELAAAAPDEALLWRALAYSARLAGQEALAVEAAGRAIDLRPDAPEGWKSLWDVFAASGRYGELSERLVVLAEKYGESAAGAHYTGFALSSARRTEEALTWLRTAWALSEGNHAARIEAARLHRFVRQDHAAAAALYEEVLAASPGHEGAVAGLAGLAARLGEEQRHEEALPYFRALARALPDEALVHANLGLALRWLGRHAEADAAYSRAVERASEDAQIRNDHGLLLLVMKRDEDATAAFLAAHEADRLHNDCLENLGFLARERGDAGEALRWFRAAWEAAVSRDEAGHVARHRRNADDVRFPLPPLPF